ncbi:MAG: substrate-binding periplasmic protein [Bacillota bacterium]
MNMKKIPAIRTFGFIALFLLALVSSGCKAQNDTFHVPEDNINVVNAYDEVQALKQDGKNIKEIIKTIKIHVADDIVEWPPYTYQKRVNGVKTDELEGYSIDVLEEIFSKNGIEYDIELMPWNRAQMEVEKGLNYYMFPSGSYSKERAEKYYISEPYYKTIPCYFYSKIHYPNGLKINNKAELKSYRVVGLKGHNYSDYGLAPEEVDMTSDSYSAAIKQLHSGYYDIMLESIEILAGHSRLNENILGDEQLGYDYMKDMEPVYFYMMFSKNEVGQELKYIFDEGIKEMTESGRLDELLRKYIDYKK